MNNRVVFADTSGLMSYLIPSLPEHLAILKLVRDHLRAGGTFVTTNYVLTELVALLSSRTRFSRPQVLSGVASISQSSRFEIVHITPALHQQAFELLQQRPDKAWSWVDAASFVVMTQRGLTVAFTGDHHFEQAGFSRLFS